MQQYEHNQNILKDDNTGVIVIKDRMISELSIENRRLKEDLAKNHY